MITTLGMKIS